MERKVKRGQRVDCDATVRNAEGRVTYTWQLKPENGGVQVWPVGDPEKLPFAGDTTTKAEWSGEVAVGGQVSVLAIDSILGDDGTPSDSIPPRTDFAHSTFTVVDRGWKIDRTLVRHGFTRAADLTGYLGGGGLAGANVSAYGSPLIDDIFEGDPGPMHGIGVGPNTVYSFIPANSEGSPPYWVDRRWALNERLEPNGPKELRDTLHGDTVNLWTYMERRYSLNWKDWIHPSDFRAAVTRHERYGTVSGTDTLKGHQGQIEKAIGWETCGDGTMLADRMVAAGPDRPHVLLDTIELAVNRAYKKAADHHNVHGHFRTYVPLWDTTFGSHPPIDTLLADAPEPDTIPAMTRCDWSTF